MKKRFRILIATDYSAAALNAELYAIQFAKSTHSVLTFLHVYEAPLNLTSIERIDFAERTFDFQKSEQQLLELHRDKLFQSLHIVDDNLKCNCIIREGNAGVEIREEAKETGADFIVMGTHGVSGFRNVFLGTHTWDVIKKSGIPVLAIPADGIYRDIKNIAFATGEREGEIPAIKYLAEVAKDFDAEITVLRITSYAVSKPFEAEMFSRFRNEITNKIHYDKLRMTLEYNEDIVEGLNAYCTREKTDWLVMSHEKTTLLERVIIPVQSITKKMSINTQVPLLCIPDYFNPDYSEFWRLFEVDEKILNEDF